MPQDFFTRDELEIRNQGNPHVPVVDVSQQVMNRLEQPQRMMLLKRPLPIVLAALALCMLTGIAGYATGVWEIRNEAGEVTYATEPLDEHSYVVRYHGYNLEPTEAERKAQKLIENVEKGLKPGTVTAVYLNDLDMNPEQTLSWLLRPWIFTQREDFQNELAARKFPSFKQPDWIPEEYRFTEGRLLMKEDSYYNGELYAKEMQEQARTTGELVITKQGEWSDEPYQAVYVYSDGKTELRFSAEFTSAKRLFVSKQAQVEKIKLHDQEAFYVQDQERNEKFVTWTKEAEPRTVYHVSADWESPLSKETLIQAAEKMK